MERKPSGAQRRKQARNAVEAAGRIETIAADGSETPLEKRWLEAYKRLGPPPSGIEVEHMRQLARWVAAINATALHEAVTDPGISPRDRRYQIAALSPHVLAAAKQGVEEARLDAMEAEVEDDADPEPDSEA